MKVKKTQTLIIESLIGLLEKQSFESLSVMQITQEALVARNSFYRNFQSKEDIVRTHVKILIDEYSSARQIVNAATPLDLALAFFPFFKKHARFILLIKKNNLLSILQDEFAVYLTSLMSRKSSQSSFLLRLSNKERGYFLAFHAAGICQVLVRWIDDGCRESERQMASLLARFVEI